METLVQILYFLRWCCQIKIIFNNFVILSIENLGSLSSVHCPDPLIWNKLRSQLKISFLKLNQGGFFLIFFLYLIEVKNSLRFVHIKILKLRTFTLIIFVENKNLPEGDVTHGTHQNTENKNRFCSMPTYLNKTFSC